MKSILFIGLLLSSSAFSEVAVSRKPETKQEQRAFEEWNEEQEEAIELSERRRRLAEERAKGYRPTLQEQEERCECPPPARDNREDIPGDIR